MKMVRISQLQIKFGKFIRKKRGLEKVGGWVYKEDSGKLSKIQ